MSDVAAGLRHSHGPIAPAFPKSQLSTSAGDGGNSSGIDQDSARYVLEKIPQ